MAAVAAVVFDASAALEVFLPDSTVRFTKAVELLEDIAGSRVIAHVPLIFFNEVAAGCARAVRGGRATRSDAKAFLARLGAVPLSLSVVIDPAGQWFERAMQWGCQVADSAYLAMALDLRAPIATFDGGLATAARSNKAKLYFPERAA
jgi:predicted nucleic acid-binding protein